MPAEEHPQRLADRWLIVDDEDAERVRAVRCGPHQDLSAATRLIVLLPGLRGRLRAHRSIRRSGGGDVAAVGLGTLASGRLRPFVRIEKSAKLVDENSQLERLQ